MEEMSMFNVQQNKGLVKAVLIVVAALIILGYLGFNIRDIAEKPVVKKNLEYAWSLVEAGWNKFLAKPARFLWEKVAVRFVWKNIDRFFGDGAVKKVGGEGIAPTTPR